MIETIIKTRHSDILRSKSAHTEPFTCKLPAKQIPCQLVLGAD